MLPPGHEAEGASSWLYLLIPYPTLAVSEKEIIKCVPVLASSSVREYNPSSMFSTVSAAVPLHILFIILISQEGKSRVPEVRLPGAAASVFSSIKWALTQES